ncbi:Protein of unknown function, partial [Gryllus bimaculatus]
MEIQLIPAECCPLCGKKRKSNDKKQKKNHAKGDQDIADCKACPNESGQFVTCLKKDAQPSVMLWFLGQKRLSASATGKAMDTTGVTEPPHKGQQRILKRGTIGGRQVEKRRSRREIRGGTAHHARTWNKERRRRRRKSQASQRGETQECTNVTQAPAILRAKSAALHLPLTVQVRNASGKTTRELNHLYEYALELDRMNINHQPVTLPPASNHIMPPEHSRSTQRRWRQVRVRPKRIAACKSQAPTFWCPHTISDLTHCPVRMVHSQGAPTLNFLRVCSLGHISQSGHLGHHFFHKSNLTRKCDPMLCYFKIGRLPNDMACSHPESALILPVRVAKTSTPRNVARSTGLPGQAEANSRKRLLPDGEPPLSESVTALRNVIFSSSRFRNAVNNFHVFHFQRPVSERDAVREQQYEGGDPRQQETAAARSALARAAKAVEGGQRGGEAEQPWRSPSNGRLLPPPPPPTPPARSPEPPRPPPPPKYSFTRNTLRSTLNTRGSRDAIQLPERSNGNVNGVRLLLQPQVLWRLLLLLQRPGPRPQHHHQPREGLRQEKLLLLQSATLSTMPTLRPCSVPALRVTLPANADGSAAACGVPALRCSVCYNSVRDAMCTTVFRATLHPSTLPTTTMRAAALPPATVSPTAVPPAAVSTTTVSTSAMSTTTVSPSAMSTTTHSQRAAVRTAAVRTARVGTAG